MGGSGSGSWYRHSAKSTTGNFHAWHIKKLVKAEVIKFDQYRAGEWQWYLEGDGGKRDVRSSIGYIADTTDSSSPYIQVKYQNKNSSEGFDYKIRLTTTNPNYGGKRWWFVCPIVGCSKRVGVLYMGSKYFACRHCYNIAYESQNEVPHYRMLHKAQAIHQKLGGSGCTMDYVPKPKGMHWNTYHTLINEMEELEHLSLITSAKKLGILPPF